MINKQNLWFLTLCSLILVLGVYYVTMPNELLLTNKNTTVKESKSKKMSKDSKSQVSQVSMLDAMRVNLEEERNEVITTLQEQLTNSKMTADEKNKAYEQLKYLNEIQGKEEALEKKIKDTYKLDCFVKVDNSNVTTVCVSSKHDSHLANNIMRTIQEQYNNKMYITVKFEKA